MRAFLRSHDLLCILVGALYLLPIVVCLCVVFMHCMDVPPATIDRFVDRAPFVTLSIPDSERGV